MKYKIMDVKVAIDFCKVVSDERGLMNFNPSILVNYKLPKKIPTKRKKSMSNKGGQGRKPQDNTDAAYRFFHQMTHRMTRNGINVFANTDRETPYLNKLKVEFYSSWENRLTFEEVVDVLNPLTLQYNLNLRLSEFHLAIDIITSEENYYFWHLIRWTKCGRVIEPKQVRRIPTLFRYHSERSSVSVTAYDKVKQLFDRKLEALSMKTKQYLKTVSVTRFEPRFRGGAVKGIAPSKSVEELACACFDFVYPKHIKFLRPHEARLRKHGITPQDCAGLSLMELRELLGHKGVHANLSYYLKEAKRLAEPVKRVLQDYRWCEEPHRYPLLHPKFIIPPQPIEFIKH